MWNKRENLPEICLFKKNIDSGFAKAKKYIKHAIAILGLLRITLSFGNMGRVINYNFKEYTLEIH